jgi:hypothetical protein
MTDPAEATARGAEYWTKNPERRSRLSASSLATVIIAPGDRQVDVPKGGSPLLTLNTPLVELIQ